MGFAQDAGTLAASGFRVNARVIGFLVLDFGWKFGNHTTTFCIIYEKILS
jgi:hypothetical protein